MPWDLGSAKLGEWAGVGVLDLLPSCGWNLEELYHLQENKFSGVLVSNFPAWTGCCLVDRAQAQLQALASGLALDLTIEHSAIQGLR